MAVEKGDYNDIPLGLFSERTLHRGWNHIWRSALCCYSQNAHQMAARINFLTSVLFSRCAIDEGRWWLFTVTYTRLYCRNSTRRQQRVPFLLPTIRCSFSKYPPDGSREKHFIMTRPGCYFQNENGKAARITLWAALWCYPHIPHQVATWNEYSWWSTLDDLYPGVIPKMHTTWKQRMTNNISWPELWRYFSE